MSDYRPPPEAYPTTRSITVPLLYNTRWWLLLMRRDCKKLKAGFCECAGEWIERIE